MKRALYSKLLEWKNRPDRKPLLLQGARQVGKTYLINEFGKKEFEDIAYLNFEEDPLLETLFTGSLKAEIILENISLYLGKKPDPAKSLIFFDEIQAVPEALTSLKYLYEQKPEYHIIAAGSLLGVSVAQHRSFPVGKVNFLTLYPLSFFEYLEASGEVLLVDKLKKIKEPEPLPEIIHLKLLDLLKKFLFLGGMPEVVKTYLDTGDIAISREIQEDILEAYERDFSKYAEKSTAVKTSELWHSIPSQLAKENKKFKYKQVRKGGRASLYGQSIEWLSKAGLINIAYNVSVPKLPLSGYADRSKFKIYLHDTGLLGAMLKLGSDMIVRPDVLFREYNGAFTENFIASALKACGGNELYYWTSKSDAEVDFLIQEDNKIYPLEVKSGMSRNTKSLRSYAGKYEPEYIFRCSPRNFVRDQDFVNLPLYAVCIINDLIHFLPPR